MFLKPEIMKCLVLIGFAGIHYAGAKGTEVNLPIDEARSLASQGIVKILEDYKPEKAFETPEAAMKGKETMTKKIKK